MTSKAKPKDEPAAVEFRPARHNANLHSQRGLGMLTRAMRERGYVAPMTAVADGEVIDGSSRLEAAEDVFGGIEPLVIDHDGSRPIIMRRIDIPSADDPRAVAIALEANRIAEVNLQWDPEVLADIAADGEVDLADLWDQHELDAFHLGTPSVEDLDAKYGEWEEKDGWPYLRVQVSPATLEQYEALMLLAPGDSDDAKLLAVLRAVNTAALVQDE